MASGDFCSHDWPGSGCPECETERQHAAVNPLDGGFSAYWRENARREAANSPPDKPTHAEVLTHGEDFATAPVDQAIWIIDPGSTGTFIGRWRGAHFFIEDAGDLWPAKPTHWLSRERAVEIVAQRIAT